MLSLAIYSQLGLRPNSYMTLKDCSLHSLHGHTWSQLTSSVRDKSPACRLTLDNLRETVYCRAVGHKQRGLYTITKCLALVVSKKCRDMSILSASRGHYVLTLTEKDFLWVYLRVVVKRRCKETASQRGKRFFWNSYGQLAGHHSLVV